MSTLPAMPWNRLATASRRSPTRVSSEVPRSCSYAVLAAYTRPMDLPRCMVHVGGMKGLAFAYDPDGYWVEIVKRGGL